MCDRSPVATPKSSLFVLSTITMLDWFSCAVVRAKFKDNLATFGSLDLEAICRDAAMYLSMSMPFIFMAATNALFALTTASTVEARSSVSFITSPMKNLHPSDSSARRFVANMRMKQEARIVGSRMVCPPSALARPGCRAVAHIQRSGESRLFTATRGELPRARNDGSCIQRATRHRAPLDVCKEDGRMNERHESTMGTAPLHQAAVNMGRKSLAELLAEGDDPNVKDNRGRTPLHHAAFYGYAENVQALLEAGADPNARDEKGWTPLNAADSGRNDQRAVGLLRGAGAKKQRWFRSLFR